MSVDSFNDLDLNVFEPPLLAIDIPVPSNLTLLGTTHWNRAKHLDWRDFPKQNIKCQGLKNLVKVLNSYTGFQVIPSRV